MNFDEQKQQQNREERKKRRQKEQLQAFAMLGGALVAVIILLVIIISGISGIIKSSSKSDKEAVAANENKQVEQTVSKEEKSAEEAETEESETEETDKSEEENGTEAEGEETTEESAEASSETEEETGVTGEITEEQKDAMLDSYVQNILSTMTLEEKVAGMFLVTPQNITGVAGALQAGSSTNIAMNSYPIGGLIYDETNMQDKDQFSQMIYNTKSFSKVELFVAVNDEGGETSPLTLGGLRETVVPGPAEIAVNGGTAGAYSAGINKGSQFRSLGINLNLAPVADVTLVDNSMIADRSYGANVENVLALAKSEVKGLSDQGINSCVKYFPGHGDVTGDTRTAKVTSRRTKEDLQNTEYVIFKDMIEEGIPMIMVSHVSMPAITGDDKPASLSGAIVTDILRGELGFDGVIVTDYMNKAAVTKYFKYADASVMAVQAGVDMIVVPGDFTKSYNGLLKAVRDGKITEERINESMVRILRMKYKNMVDYDTVATESLENTEPTEATEPTENTEPTEATEPTEVTEPTEATEPTEVTEP